MHGLCEPSGLSAPYGVRKNRERRAADFDELLQPSDLMIRNRSDEQIRSRFEDVVKFFCHFNSPFVFSQLSTPGQSVDFSHSKHLGCGGSPTKNSDIHFIIDSWNRFDASMKAFIAILLSIVIAPLLPAIMYLPLGDLTTATRCPSWIAKPKISHPAGA
jgi:hypothetical protein